MSKINLEYIFPTAVYTIQLEGMDKIHKDLINHIYSLKTESTTAEDYTHLKGDIDSYHNHPPNHLDEQGKLVESSTQGGWYTNDLDTNNIYIKPLTQKLFPLINTIGENLGWDLEKYSIYCDKMWSIVNPQYSYNTSHTHNNSILSCAYYLKIPKNMKGGEFIFEDPRTVCNFFPMPKVLENVPKTTSTTIGTTNGRCNEIAIKPEEGLLIVFPSWVAHKVRAHYNNSNRIVLSFNLSHKEKETQEEEW
tara:strand:- start:146 stop:892 length:747 start_codon:yes stop_codon:yes gene_type:complete